ncbi:hypothetical protein COW36_06975 [bacterium (Candidatus Blackallbacteria) CG17_big_fil_post_rev_8_21_14_2_50_48_46]|uniref:Uncharacterized protein n=1 Tax=bacterium (Candidatus Blackallbacteria) CG17_big_fil_post_rev_8_21_14_2_50_48_46 TaxID=2014261 RepID=A0A2M7G794_9BACT|nr:MAG: hypothetical protein COW64_05305 [bacterium (Candidatus Blackallbacteria) CG18_big_fil_WC_8_21_14_2_50_49_26]PIW17939.1 MAG: hypothetical protein COW36_06975 [bacterium (Candidatus Blackallbacteria) CG17_big_fil_post_rev_8_21_14_2_50_48_46]PIW45758.1 MAG: hypothetical protein COW20_19155 [bacterium (Candidatus Blackallbacteria) CG13_big_fil_rev_8_21_14_2_50_49_14]
MPSISSQSPSFTPLSPAPAPKRLPLAEARQKILADGKVEQKEIRVLDQLRISSAARSSLNRNQVAQTDQAVNQAQANLSFLSRLQQTLQSGENLSGSEISTLAGELKIRQGALNQTVQGFERALNDPALSGSNREVLALELKVAKQESALYSRLEKDISVLGQTLALKKIKQTNINQAQVLEQNQKPQDPSKAQAAIVQIRQENQTLADSYEKVGAAFVKSRELPLSPGQSGPPTVSVNPTGQLIQILTQVLRDPQSPAKLSPELVSEAKREGLLPSSEIDRLQATVLKQVENNQKLLELDARLAQIKPSDTAPTQQTAGTPSLSEPVNKIIAGGEISTDLKNRLQTLSPQARERLNQNPELLKNFSQVSNELVEGLQTAGRSGVSSFSRQLNQAFVRFLETQDAQALSLVASGSPSTPQLGQYLVNQSGVADLARRAELEKQIKPFQDAAGLLAGRQIELDFGKDSQGKDLKISGKDLNRNNYVETLARAAAELGVEPRVFAEYVRNQVLENPDQKRFLVDTPEKQKAFKSAADQAAQAPGAKFEDYLAKGADLFSNLKEGLEAPQKILDKEFFSGDTLEREDARPQNITESLKTLQDANAGAVDKLAAAGTLVQAYKGFLERFNTLSDQQDQQKLLRNFLGPGKSPEEFIKGLDGIGGALGTFSNLRAIANNLNSLYQGSDPIRFQAVPGSNALQLPEGKAAIFNEGDSVTLDGKNYQVKAVNTANHQIELEPSPTVANGQLRANFSLTEKGLKGLEIVTKTSDIVESAHNLAKASPFVAEALKKGGNLLRNEAQFLKSAITGLVKDAQLAERVSEFTSSLQKTFNAISPGVGDQFIAALSQKPELLKKFTSLAGNINSYVGLDKLTEGLKAVIPKIIDLGPEKIAEAASTASGPGALSAKAESRIPVLGFLANVGFLSKDLGTLIGDYRAGKDDFTNFNNLVGVVSDVASFFPAGQSLSLVLDSYSIGVGVGTLINEGTGLKEAIQNQVKFQNGISDQQIAQETLFNALNKEGVIGNGEALLRTAQKGVGRAIVRASSEADLKNMLALSIDGDLKAGRISKTEALLLRRNANLPDLDGEILDNASYRQKIASQLNQDLDTGKITQAEAFVFKLALEQEPPTTLAGVPQNRKNQELKKTTFSIEPSSASARPEEVIRIDISEEPVKSEKTNSPIELTVSGQPAQTPDLSEPILPNAPGKIQIDTPSGQDKNFQIQVPLSPPPPSPVQEPQISIQNPKSAPTLEVPLSQDGTLRQTSIPSFRGVFLTRTQIETSLNQLKQAVQSERNPVKRMLLQNKVDKLQLYIQQGAPGAVQSIFS